jgi:hypothetical protein
MYEMIEWNKDLDLTDFYAEAERRGHINNANQKSMVDCFQDEERWQVWILYKNNKAIGSVAAHTFLEMGFNAYRILARTCVLDGVVTGNGKGLGSGRLYIQQHQNITCQFFIPKMIEWCGIDSDMYATSNQLDSGSQRKVHNIYFPLLERQGEFSRDTDLYYRGAIQTVWKLNPHRFLNNLNNNPRWSN